MERIYEASTEFDRDRDDNFRYIPYYQNISHTYMMMMVTIGKNMSMKVTL